MSSFSSHSGCEIQSARRRKKACLHGFLGSRDLYPRFISIKFEARRCSALKKARHIKKYDSMRAQRLWKCTLRKICWCKGKNVHWVTWVGGVPRDVSTSNEQRPYFSKKSKKTFTKGKPTSDRETVPPRHYRPRPRPRHHPHPHPHPPWPSRSRRSRPPPVEAQANVGIRDGARCDDDRCVHRGRPEVRVAVPMPLV